MGGDSLDLDRAPAGYQLDYEYSDSDYQQDVDKTAESVGTNHPKQP